MVTGCFRPPFLDPGQLGSSSAWLSGCLGTLNPAGVGFSHNAADCKWIVAHSTSDKRLNIYSAGHLSLNSPDGYT